MINLFLWAFPFGSGYSLQSFCLGKKISAAIPNAKQALRACWGIVFERKNEAFLSETRQILQP
jgi:hypothetical protein